MRKPSPQLLDLLAGCSPGVAHLALALRELVLAEAPEAEEVLYSVYAEVVVFRFPNVKRGAFCYVAAYSQHVNLGFYYGAELPDPHGALKGTGKQARHIRFDSLDDLRHPYLRGYIQSAIGLVGVARASNSAKSDRRLAGALQANGRKWCAGASTTSNGYQVSKIETIS